MFKINLFVLLSFTILFSSNCSLMDNLRYYKISNYEFHQGHDQNDERNALDGNKKKVAIYDEFITKAIFDVLYLSDSVRIAYVNKHVQKKGLDDSTKKRLLSTELEQNKNWIKFYILSDIRDKEHDSLTAKNSTWSLFLRFNDETNVQPLSIKEVELPPEYQYFFGSRFTLFQRYYEVTFPAKNLNNRSYIRDKTPFKLFFSSSYKETALIFNEDIPVITEEKKEPVPEKKVICDCCKACINRKPTKKSRLHPSINKNVTKKSRPKTKKRKILNGKDFYWI